MKILRRMFCDLSRLSKVIASSGMYSRRQAEKVIKDGRVKVNYELVTTVTQKVSSKDKVFLDDFELQNDYQVDRPRLWMANKLRGEIVATQDPVLNRPLMLVRFKSILDEVGDLKPINKLEINTEGLQLLTNSPLLANLMENNTEDGPQFLRKYRLRVHGKLTPSKLEGMTRGPHVKGIKYRPMIPTFERTNGVTSWLTLTCSENKSRFLRNCFEQMFLQITRAISIEFGSYKLPKDLTPGSIREIQLTPELEQLYLKTIASKKRPKKESKVTNSNNRNREHGEDTRNRFQKDRL